MSTAIETVGEDVERLQINWNQHKKVLHQSMSNYLFSEKFTDITVACNQHSYRCHRAILAAGSHYFERLLSNTKSEQGGGLIVVIANAKPEILSSLINYMYSGATSVSYDQLFDFYNTAVSLEVRGIYDNQQEFLAWTSEIENGCADILSNAAVTPVTKKIKKSELANLPDKFGVTILPKGAYKAASTGKASEGHAKSKVKSTEKTSTKEKLIAPSKDADVSPILQPNLSLNSKDTTPDIKPSKPATKSKAKSSPGNESGTKPPRKPRTKKVKVLPISPDPACPVSGVPGTQNISSSPVHFWTDSRGEPSSTLPLKQIMEVEDLPPNPKRAKIELPGTTSPKSGKVEGTKPVKPKSEGKSPKQKQIAAKKSTPIRVASTFKPPVASVAKTDLDHLSQVIDQVVKAASQPDESNGEAEVNISNTSSTSPDTSGSGDLIIDESMRLSSDTSMD